MRRLPLGAIALPLAVPAAAQTLTAPPLNPSTVATKSDVTTAIAGVQAQVPAPCTTAPPADTLAGTVGSATPCTPRPDSTRPTQVQRKAVTTAADGTFTGTWDTAWPTTPTAAFAQANTTTAPFICQVGAWTATSFSGKCWQMIPSTLPATLTSLPGYVMSPFINAAAGIPVSIVGRQ